MSASAADAEAANEHNGVTTTMASASASASASVNKVRSWPVDRLTTKTFGRASDFTKWRETTNVGSADGSVGDRYLNDFQCRFCTPSAQNIPTGVLAFPTRADESEKTTRARPRVKRSRTDATPPAVPPFLNISEARDCCLALFQRFVRQFPDNALCNSFCFQWAVVVVDHCLVLRFHRDNHFLNTRLLVVKDFENLSTAIIWLIHKTYASSMSMPQSLQDFYSMSKRTNNAVLDFEVWVVQELLQWNVFQVVPATRMVLVWFEQNTCDIVSTTCIGTTGVSTFLQFCVMLCDLYYCNRIEIEQSLCNVAMHDQIAMASLLCTMDILGVEHTVLQSDDELVQSALVCTLLLRDRLHVLYRRYAPSLRVTRSQQSSERQACAAL